MIRTLALAVVRMLVGVIASWALVRSVNGLLYGVPSGDPPTFLAAAIVLLSSAALAGYLPARRASKVDPMICLRAD